MTTLKQHPLSAAFPAMLAEEFQELRDSINIVGVRNAITLLDGMVLDGWHRYTIATEYGMDCPTVELDDDVDPVDFVRAQNIARRKLTPSQTAYAVANLYAWRPPHRPNKSAVTAGLLKTTKELADIAGVGTRTIEHAKSVHAGAVAGVQDAVKAGAVSLETAAAVAKLPATEQQAIAAGGPDAMRAAAKPKAKAVAKSGTSANKSPAEIGTSATPVKLESPQSGGTSATSEPAAKTQKQLEAEQNAADAHGDSDPIAMLEEAQKEIQTLQQELFALQADDQKAEILKYRRIADLATRRQNELMDTINIREKELQHMANWQRRIGKIVGQDDPIKIAAIVEAMFRTQSTGTCGPARSEYSVGFQ